MRIFQTALALMISAPASAQQGAEACTTIARGIERLACYDKAYGLEMRAADPLPTVKVAPVRVTRDPPPADEKEYPR